MENAVEVRGLGKRYRIYPNPYDRIAELVTLGKVRRHKEVWALRGIDLQVPWGSALGLVGENGAGKSTLLKILSGTTFPTEGSYSIRGTVASLLELGAGFHADFSGRENIFMNAAILGFSRKEVEKKFREIVEFSGLEAFIDAPIRTYSSGMVMRLGFSTAVSVDPDVLIIDEIFAVGDMEFQRKCVDKIWEFKRRGKTILFCSHSLYDVRQLCEKAIWIKDGRIEAMGDSVSVTNQYAEFQKARLEKDTVVEACDLRPIGLGGKKAPRVEKAWVADPRTGEQVTTVYAEDPVDVVVEYVNQDPPVELCVGIGFTRTDTVLAFAHTTEMDGVRVGGKAGRVTLKLPRLNLLEGDFVVFVYLMDGKGIHRYHQYLTENNLTVRNRRRAAGLYPQEHTWRVEDIPVASPYQGLEGGS